MKIGLIGDLNEAVTAHRAIPIALELAAKQQSMALEYTWIHSSEISVSELKEFSALWCVPVSPYENTENVLKAIKYSREMDLPFLGTCGGYQHAALEFARNVLGYGEAENAEIDPDAAMPLISSLVCKLYDEEAFIDLDKNSVISEIYGQNKNFGRVFLWLRGEPRVLTPVRQYRPLFFGF